MIAGSVSALCAAAESSAAGLGYRTLLLTTTLNCEAREAGSFLASIARQIRACGTPGASMRRGSWRGDGGASQGEGQRRPEPGTGPGGRAGNQGAEGHRSSLLGSDGTDGPTDAAGGLVDGHTAEVLAGLGMDPEALLAENDSYRGLDACGCLVRTGPTGTNVNDLAVLLVR